MIDGISIDRLSPTALFIEINVERLLNTTLYIRFGLMFVGFEVRPNKMFWNQSQDELKILL